MSVYKPSVVKDCVVTTVTCGLGVGSVSAVVCAIAVYFKELLALAVTFGGYVATVFGSIAPWLSQDLPSAVKWIALAAFLWSFCISYNLERKGVTGVYATVVNRTKVAILGGFALYWLVQLFIQLEPELRLVMVSVLSISGFLLYCLIKMEEEDRLKHPPRQQSEQDALQSQGADQ